MFKSNIFFFILVVFIVQKGKGQSIDSAQLAGGQRSFELNCITCHNFTLDGIGPNLGGIKDKVSVDWLVKFIRNPKAIIDSKDKRATAQFNRFKTIMPSFSHLNNDEIKSIVAYISTKSAPKTTVSKMSTPEVVNPFQEKIKLSDLVLNMELYTEIPFSSDTKLHTRIVKMGFHPETKENFILDLRGKLYEIKDKKPVEYMDMAKYMPKFIQVPGLATGFGSFAFHPDFMKNGLFYTTHTEAANSAKADFAYADSIKVALQWVVSEWKTDEPLAVPFKGANRELFRVNMVNVIHGIQEIAFNPNSKPNDADYGLLYIGVGDGGSVEAGYPFIPHNKKNIWGNIIRIDPKGNNSKNGKYGIPVSNPFYKKGNLSEIYAMGFRNPHRFSWTKSGKMLVSNIGQKQIESINVTLPGHDYGWPMREGTFAVDQFGDINKIYALPKDDKKFNYTYPVIQIDHDEINAISGGFEYVGNDLPQLKGKYVFGSIVDGRLFYANEKDLINGKSAEIKEWKVAFNGKLIPMRELAGNDRVDLRLGCDYKGELFIFTKPNGKVYKLVK